MGLPDPNGPLSFNISAEAIWDANDAHSLLSTQSNQQIQGDKHKWPQGSYMKWTPVHQAQITK